MRPSLLRLLLATPYIQYINYVKGHPTSTLFHPPRTTSTINTYRATAALPSSTLLRTASKINTYKATPPPPSSIHPVKPVK